VSVDHLLFDAGDRVTGWGELRLRGDEVWLDPPHPVLCIGTPGPLSMSQYAVRLHGADVSVAVSRPGADGAATRWATVTGVWLGSAIRVEEQSPEPPPQRPEPTWTRPPCPPPVGGWPVRRVEGDFDDLEFDLGDLQETGAAVSVTIFRPGAGQTVLVVAATDEAAVERRLRPQLGARLCVIRSRWTKSEVEQVTSVLLRQMDEWTLMTFGEGADDDGQLVVRAQLFRVRPDMARWAAGVPDGLLEVSPALAPAAR